MVVKKNAHFQCVALILLFNIKKASCLCFSQDLVFLHVNPSSLTSMFMRWCCNCFQHDITIHLLSLQVWHPPPPHCCFSVCVCVVLCEHSLSVSLAAMVPGTSVDPWEPFSNRLGLKWICTVLYNEWYDQEPEQHMISWRHRLIMAGWFVQI